MKPNFRTIIEDFDLFRKKTVYHNDEFMGLYGFTDLIPPLPQSAENQMYPYERVYFSCSLGGNLNFFKVGPVNRVVLPRPEEGLLCESFDSEEFLVKQLRLYLAEHCQAISDCLDIPIDEIYGIDEVFNIASAAMISDHSGLFAKNSQLRDEIEGSKLDAMTFNCEWIERIDSVSFINYVYNNSLRQVKDETYLARSSSKTVEEDADQVIPCRVWAARRLSDRSEDIWKKFRSLQDFVNLTVTQRTRLMHCIADLFSNDSRPETSSGNDSPADGPIVS